MVDLDLNFCDRYDYPPEISRHFRRIFEPLDPSHVRSVLLIGGTSRGELSYRASGDSIDLFSDYEFLIVSEGWNNRSFEHSFRKHVLSVEEDIRSTPFFHIDFNYLSPRSLRSLDKSFFTYDAKETGIPIWGTDPRPQMPTVTQENIDLKESNETLLWRLWSMFLHAPTSLVEGKLTEPWRTYFEYAVCKNSLDLTTWAFPHEGMLVSTYGKRVERFVQDFESFEVKSKFDDDFPKFLEDCLTGKLDLALGEAPLNRYADALRHFESALDYVRSEFGPPGRSEEVFRTASNCFFRDRKPKYLAYDGYCFLKYGLGRGTGLGWLARGKRGLTLLVLLSIHRFLLTAAKGSPNIEHLRTAEDRFDALQLDKSVGENERETRGSKREWTNDSGKCKRDLINRYETLRRQLVTFMQRYYVWIGHQQSHVQDVQLQVTKNG